MIFPNGLEDYAWGGAHLGDTDHARLRVRLTYARTKYCVVYGIYHEKVRLTRYPWLPNLDIVCCALYRQEPGRNYRTPMDPPTRRNVVGMV